MKKILAMLLCVVMVVSVATLVSAAETTKITYDFAGLAVGEAITDGLATFNAATTDTSLVSVDVSKVYAGNADGGAHKGENGYLKTGTGSVAGQIVLTYPETLKASKVEIVCHD